MSLVHLVEFSRLPSEDWQQNQYVIKLVSHISPGRLLLNWLGVFGWRDHINSLKPRQNDRLVADDTFKRIFLNENVRISTKNSLKFVPKGLINNIPALARIMAWRRPGDKPLSEPMLVRSLTHICVTRPQWVKSSILSDFSLECFLLLFEWRSNQLPS